MTKRIRPIFIKGREIIDRLNKVINESILGSALIRVVNAQLPEYEKFLAANTEAKSLGMSVLKLFAWLIPIIILTASFANISILALGGHYVISGTMSLGDFAAFNSYLSLLIFPIILIGFMSNVIAQASASYQRLQAVLNIPSAEANGEVKDPLRGEVSMENLTLTYGEKKVLKNISFQVEGGSSLAIIGPTAAGKTQLLYLLSGLVQPSEGSILYDGRPLSAFDKENFYRHIGLVFQDSILFNMSIRENIAFSKTVTDEALRKAVATAELHDFIESLPEKMETVVSERGTSLSGGQKQRIAHAQALTLNLSILCWMIYAGRYEY
jgi:ATP-binding cassette subfamily B protein